MHIHRDVETAEQKVTLPEEVADASCIRFCSTTAPNPSNPSSYQVQNIQNISLIFGSNKQIILRLKQIYKLNLSCNITFWPR